MLSNRFPPTFDPKMKITPTAPTQVAGELGEQTVEVTTEG